jgi:hypothetical protein
MNKVYFVCFFFISLSLSVCLSVSLSVSLSLALCLFRKMPGVEREEASIKAVKRCGVKAEQRIINAS